jgi:hypothetical protein
LGHTGPNAPPYGYRGRPGCPPAPGDKHFASAAISTSPDESEREPGGSIPCGKASSNDPCGAARAVPVEVPWVRGNPSSLAAVASANSGAGPTGDAGKAPARNRKGGATLAVSGTLGPRPLRACRLKARTRSQSGGNGSAAREDWGDAPPQSENPDVFRALARRSMAWPAECRASSQRIGSAERDRRPVSAVSITPSASVPVATIASARSGTPRRNTKSGWLRRAR